MKNSYEIRGDVTAIFLFRKGDTLETLIDTADLPIVQLTSVRYRPNYQPRSKTFYVGGFVSRKETSGKSVYVLLHRIITGATDGEQVDHGDHDGLNNRRFNLKRCTPTENLLNRRGATSRSTTGIRGVYRTISGRWKAEIKIRRKSHSLGVFDTPGEAEKAFLEALRTRIFPQKQLGTVYFDSSRRKWSVQVTIGGKTASVGRYQTKEAGASALAAYMGGGNNA